MLVGLLRPWSCVFRQLFFDHSIEVGVGTGSTKDGRFWWSVGILDFFVNIWQRRRSFVCLACFLKPSYELQQLWRGAANSRGAYIGLLEQRLLATVAMTLTMAIRVTLLAGAQVGHQRIPRVLVHGVDRAQGFAGAPVTYLRSHATGVEC